MYKGEIEGFPREVVDMMLCRQEEQGHKRDVSIFEKDRLSGFSWSKSVEGYSFWENVLLDRNFYLFFNMYPNKSSNYPASTEEWHHPHFEVKKEGVLAGQKFDDGKLPYYTVLFKQFPNALREVVKCSLAGHNKYHKTDSDWQNFSRNSGDDRYKNAMLRHMTEVGPIEDMAEFGEMTHEAAVVWNALADLEIKLRELTKN